MHRSFSNTVGKPADAAREHAFSELCNFLDETDECQYSLSELLELMETFLDGEDRYFMQYLKKKLLRSIMAMILSLQASMGNPVLSVSVMLLIEFCVKTGRQTG